MSDYASLAVGLKGWLIVKFEISPLDAAAIVGNLFHESNDFTEIREVSQRGDERVVNIACGQARVVEFSRVVVRNTSLTS